MKVKNLTPHDITVMDEDNNVIKVYPSEGVARATQIATPAGEIDGVEVVRMAYGKPVDLPDPEKDVMLIVSLLTAQAADAAGRRTDDLLLVADQVRDKKGSIIGCRKFARV